MHNPHRRSAPGIPLEECDARCLAYAQAFAYTMRQPCMVLDATLSVHVANEAFCQVFQIPMRLVEGRPLFALGNGEWDIPALRALLEEVLRTRSFFMGFEVVHDFPFLGRKHLVVNAYAPQVADDAAPLVFLSLEDMTGIMSVAETITAQIREIGTAHRSSTEELETQLERLRQEMGGRRTGRRPTDEL